MEARGCRQRAAERSGQVREDRGRLVELLSAEEAASVRQELEQRAEASTALAELARDDPASLAERLPELVDELQVETTRGVPDDAAEATIRRSLTVRARLLRAVARVIADDPDVVTAIEDPAEFTEAITTDLDDETVRTAANALFAGAKEHPTAFASAADRLGDLSRHPDTAVRAWSAGALGRLAHERPDAVAPVAPDLRTSLDHDDGVVQHNAVEALATLARERPDSVAPAAGDLQDLLGHDETAIQHNAAGVLGQLAADHPDAVVPAAADLAGLLNHDDEAVRRVATGALARLAEARPGAVGDG